ncbi:Thioredoxin-like superfamily [Sesbania bispinosa]|nr:Thioredoxin-like superfamily [Sesbania bispinosa]
MATPVKVYGPAMSTAVSRVLASLIEKDIQFQLIPVNMSKGEHKNPNFLKIQLAFAPRMKLKQDEGVIKQNQEKLAKVLDVYDKRLAENRFLAGDEFSLADLSHLPNTHYLVSADSDTAALFTSRNNVSRWWTEISTRESWKKVVDLHGTA